MIAAIVFAATVAAALQPPGWSDETQITPGNSARGFEVVGSVPAPSGGLPVQAPTGNTNALDDAGNPWFHIPAAAGVCYPVECGLADVPVAGSGAAPPPAGPSLPDLAESAFVRVELTVPELSLVPATLGYTQTPTTLTITGPTTLTDSEALSGADLTVRATPVGYWISFAAGDPTATDEATAVHWYRRSGCHTIRVEVTWAGEWSLDSATWTAIGTRSTRAEVDYPVAQIVGVLVHPGDPPAPEPPQRTAALVCAPGEPRHARPWPGA